MQQAIDIEAGRRLRDKGMNRVIDNAATDWKGAALAFTHDYVSRLPVGVMFTGEDIRLAALSAGIEPPHHHNAWSAVIGSQIRTFLRFNVIFPAGVCRGKDPRAHARRMMQYVKLARYYSSTDD